MTEEFHPLSIKDYIRIFKDFMNNPTYQNYNALITSGYNLPCLCFSMSCDFFVLQKDAFTQPFTKDPCEACPLGKQTPEIGFGAQCIVGPGAVHYSEAEFSQHVGSILLSLIKFQLYVKDEPNHE